MKGNWMIKISFYIALSNQKSYQPSFIKNFYLYHLISAIMNIIMQSDNKVSLIILIQMLCYWDNDKPLKCMQLEVVSYNIIVIYRLC